MAMTAVALLCLQEAIYHEARGEPEPGQFGVGETIERRVGDPRWPGSVCEVVYQPHQFEWTASPPPVTEPEAWEKAGRIAEIILERPTTATNCADHFAHIDMEPEWAASMVVDVEIGGHAFYCSNEDDWRKQK